MSEDLLENQLFDNGVYNAWQFIINTEKTIFTVKYCKEVILALITKMADQHDEWKNNLFDQLMSQNGKIKCITVTTNSLPKYEISIADKETSVSFLLNKLIKDFFQYSRNVFDSMAQVANAACLAFKAKKVDSVDFPFMLRVFQQQTYSQAFPTMDAWFLSISDSDQFKYINAFSNRTKHTCDVYLKVSMALLGDENESVLNPFYQKDVQQGKQDIAIYLSAIYDFIENAYQGFLASLEVEFPKKIFVMNRFHQIKIYQQYMKENSNSSFSMAYIDASGNIDSLADEIQLLFLKESDGVFYGKNCSIDTIYIKDPEQEHYYIGKYVAVDSYGDDTLLGYRNYRKVPYQEGTLPLNFQAMIDEKQKNVFYHSNMFMDIITVSDDDDFIKRVQLPF